MCELEETGSESIGRGLQARAAWELGGDLGLLQVSLTNRELDALLPDLVDSSSQTKEIMDFFF